MKLTTTIQNKPSFSRLIAGTMHWGVWGKHMNTKKRLELIECAHDIGVTTFDHADIYGNYTTEKDFGLAFSQSSLSRDHCQFISKCGIAMVCDNTDYKTKHYDYRATHIIESVNNSLQNLKTEYLDLLLFHRPSPLLDPAEVAKAIDKLLQSGKILSFGVSNFNPSQIDLLAASVPIQVNQIEISLTHHDSLLNGQLDYCQKNHILPMSWGSLGILKKPQSEWPTRLRSALNEMADKYDCGVVPLALAWLLKHPSKIHPIFGTSNPQRMLEIGKALKVTLETEDWFFLLESVVEKPCP